MNATRGDSSRPRAHPAWTAALVLALTLALAATVPAQAVATLPGEGPSPSALFAARAEPDRRGFFEVARDSLTGPADDGTWHPLSLRTFFTEGWDEAWAAEPDASGDAQQGWINAADGNFYRLYFFSYTFTNRVGRPDGHTGSYTIYLPLSRRFEMIFNVPFVTSQPTFGLGKQPFPNPNPPGRRPTTAGFGDMTFTPRFMLIEKDDFTLVAQLAVQVPSGTRGAGAGQSIVSPGVQFWWNFAEGWVLRGGFSPGVGTNRQAGGTTLASQLAIGKVFTPADLPYFGDFTVYLSANAFNTVSASRTLATLTPGFRTHLGGGWYALGGVEIPVTGRRPFEEGAIAWIMKTF